MIPKELSPRAYALLGVVILFWFALFLGNRPFATPDEARYVEIPREMLATGDFITPRLNGVKYFEKPPLFYWLEAASLRVFGLHEWAMRLWTIILATLGCLGTIAFTHRFFNPRTAVTAGLILAATPLYYAISRLIILDMPVTVFVTLSLFTFMAAVHTPPGRQRRLLYYAFTVLCALGVLTKGVMALAVPGPIIVIWATTTRQWSRVFPAYIPTATLLFFAIAAPWHILASLENPEFAYKYFIVEHIDRYLTDVHSRSKAVWFYVPVLLIGFFPWITLLWRSVADGLKRENEQRPITIFLLIWVTWVFGFFTVATSKLIPYVLPAFPPLAILVAQRWQIAWDTKDDSGLRTFAIATGTLGIACILAVTSIPTLLDHIPHKIIDFVAVGTLLFLCCLLTLWFIGRKLPRSALAMLPATAVLIIASLIHLSPDLQRRSIKPLADKILSIKTPDDRIGSLRSYFQDLPVYLGQTVIVIEAAGELEFGMLAEDTSAWMIKENRFLELWSEDKRMLIVVRKIDLENLLKRVPQFKYIELMNDRGLLLITNKDT